MNPLEDIKKNGIHNIMNKNLVFLLCRKETNYIVGLRDTLVNSNKDVFIVRDDKNIPDSFFKNKGYYNASGRFTNPTTWEKSLFLIFTNKLYFEYDYFYFIEDDVYARDLNTFIRLIDLWNTNNSDLIAKEILSKNGSEEWAWWQSNQYENFNEPWKSFNPICRLSSKLLYKVHQYQLYYNTLNFIEILFPSIVHKFNMSYTDYAHDECGKYITKVIAVPHIQESEIVDDGIYHPCKFIT